MADIKQKLGHTTNIMPQWVIAIIFTKWHRYFSNSKNKVNLFKVQDNGMYFTSFIYLKLKESRDYDEVLVYLSRLVYVIG